MRLHVPFVLALSALAQATPVAKEFAKRDGAAVVAAVAQISESMIALNTTVTSYIGGFLGTATALKIQIQAITLSNDVKDAISVAEDSADFDNTESINVAAAFLDLQPNIDTTLDNFVRKKPQIDTGLLGIGSLSFLVKANLENLRDLSAELGAVVVPKLTPPYAAIAPAVLQLITDKFDETIEIFSS
ncbi:hydrophobic surface binding protein A-domain-containing protein [Aspergillus granulosus]|uniref:Hydrophobic surface binding protein A-domain-containing protein n=1 Tax=Aspergillus granulosus TaxID=176169 RepID=A0ABR4H7J4_9EURO